MSGRRAAALAAALALLSRLTGFLRESVISGLVGGKDDVGVLRAAFSVPDLIALVIAGGAVGAVFVPIFAEYWEQKREVEAWRVFGTVVTVAGLIVAALVGAMELGIVPLTRLLNARFSPAELAQCAHYSRILLPAQWALLIGGLLGGTLYARRRFLTPGLAPVLYNVGQIVGVSVAALGSTSHAARLEGMAWGATIGAFGGSLVLPALDMALSGSRWRPRLELTHPGVVRLGKLMGPVILGQSLYQLNIFLTARLATPGKLAILTNAYNLTQAPIGIFAQSLGIALLPTLSELASRDDWGRFRVALRRALRQALFLTVPASVLLATLSTDLVRVALKHGEFREADVGPVAGALVAYSAATFAWATGTLLARAFYARKDTATPLWITTPMVFVFLAVGGLIRAVCPEASVEFAALTSLLGILASALLLWRLQKTLGALGLRDLLGAMGRISLASAGAGAAAWLSRWLLEPHLGVGKLGASLTFVLASSAGVLVYGLLCHLLRVRELAGVLSLISRRISR